MLSVFSQNQFSTYLLIKPKKDIRNLGNRLTTHDGIGAQALTVDRVSDIFNQLENMGTKHITACRAMFPALF